MDTPPPPELNGLVCDCFLHSCKLLGISSAKQAQTSLDLYDCSRVKCTDVRLSVSSSLRLPGIPSANRVRPVRLLGTPIYSQISRIPWCQWAKTSLGSLFKASRELLQFMHWSATVSDTVTDFQYLQCRTLKTSFDLSGLPSHKHLYSTAPDAIADFKESLVPHKFRPVSTSMDPQAHCTSLRLSWRPGRLPGISGARQLS